MSAVEMGGMYIESSSVSAEDVIASVSPKDEEAPKAREVKPIPPSKEAAETDDADDAERVSKAASELGKRGAKALADKKAEAAKADSQSDGPDEDEEPEEGKKAKPGSGNDLRERLKESTRTAAEAKREAAAERAERQKLEARLADIEAKIAPKVERPEPKPAPKGEPKPSDFDDYGDYVKAAARHEFTEAQRVREEEAAKYQATITSQRQQREVQDFETQRETKFKEVFREAVAADPTLAEVLKRIHPDLQGARTVYGAIKAGEPVQAKHFVADEFIDSENPIALARYFADHKEEYERLAALKTPKAVMRAMAKVEAKLHSTSDAASTGSGVKDVASKAKTPVKPVTGSPTVGSDEPNEDAPLSAFVQNFNRRMAQASR